MAASGDVVVATHCLSGAAVDAGECMPAGGARVYNRKQQRSILSRTSSGQHTVRRPRAGNIYTHHRQADFRDENGELEMGNSAENID